MTVVILTTTGASAWTVPAGVTQLDKIEVWGAAGSGANRGSQPPTGGGGGAYSAVVNLAVTAGASVFCSIGSGGASQTVSGSVAPDGDGFAGGDTWANIASNAAPTLATQGALAKGGAGGLGAGTGSHAGGAGGLASGGIGTTKFSGGNGGSGTPAGSATGGGGAASPSSNGAAGIGTTTAAATDGGAAGTGGGAGGTAAGARNGTASNEGGGGAAGTITASTNGGTGGYPGGGGGAVGGSGVASGAGANGQIRITYTAAAGSVSGTGAAAVAGPAITGAGAAGAAAAPVTPSAAAFAIGTTEGPLFVALELDTYRPGGTYATAGFAFGEAPVAAMPPAAAAAADSTTIRASDLGYVSRATDSIGTQVYVPTLEQGFAANRQIDLAPGTAAYSASWGDVRLASDDRRYDAGLIGTNADQRAVKILLGRKTRDEARGLWVDPPYANLAPLFTGLAQPWQADDRALAVPVRDFGAYLERPYLQDAYGGTGGLDGTADIAGRLKPRLRGGSASTPVLNIAPVRIDTVNNVWQISDGEATITALYENGAAVFTFAGDVADLYVGSTPAGNYRTNKARGLFQLGSPNAGQITCDAWAKFPGAGALAQDQANTIALQIISLDLALASATYDATSFTTIDAGAAYEAGWYWDGSQQEDCATAVARFLAAINARLITRRDGVIACLPLRAVATGATPAGAFATAQIVSLRRARLPATVAPPLYRLRWGYNHNHTPMTSGLNGTVTDARRQFLGTADRFAATSDNSVLLRYRRPNDAPPIPTALLASADAAAMATQVLGLWSADRRLYSVELPIALALRHDLGDVLSITYPLDNLDAGKLGVVVGEQLRLGDATSSLMVLV
jgi:hypothetical protein